MVSIAGYMRKAARRGLAPGVALTLCLSTSPLSTLAQAPGTYGNRQPGQYGRAQDIDPRRGDRDYIVPENDPYLAPEPQMSPRQQYCRELEQRLARDWIEKNRGSQDLPRIEEEMRKLRQTYRRLELRAERKKCYEYFLFSKTVRRTRRCFAMHKKIQEAQRRLSALEVQYQRINGARQGSNYQRNELIASLARNGCGRQYQQAARKNSWGIFDFLQPNHTRVDPRGRLQHHHMPFATYRTMCVRLCDGYYFPVSFSAMSSRFDQDDNTCRSKCAAPARLFVYENPGGSVETMTSIDGIAYSELPNAWRYRKTFINGCSCKLADYNPARIQQFENAKGGTGKQAGGQSANNGLGAPNVGNNARSLVPEARRSKALPKVVPKIPPKEVSDPKRATPEQKVETGTDPVDSIAAKLAQSEPSVPGPKPAGPAPKRR